MGKPAKRLYKGQRVVVVTNPYGAMLPAPIGARAVVTHARPGGSTGLVGLRFATGLKVRAWLVTASGSPTLALE